MPAPKGNKYALGNSGGRPSLYTPDLITKCYEYVETWKDSGDMIPSHEGLMLFIGISKTCTYDWAKEEGKEEFSSILDKIMLMQKQELINKGLSNDFNSNITKLVLGKHGLSEKRELSGDPGKPVMVIATEMSADEATAAYKSIIDD